MNPKVDTTFPFQAKVTLEALTIAILEKVAQDAAQQCKSSPAAAALAVAGRVRFLGPDNQPVALASVLVTLGYE